MATGHGFVILEMTGISGSQNPPGLEGKTSRTGPVTLIEPEDKG